MTYLEYRKLVFNTLPDLQPLAKGNMSAPEMLKKVAEHLFIQNITEGDVVDTTRKHLNILTRKGVHGFEAPPAVDNPLGGATPPSPGEKSGFNPSEFM